MYGAKIKDLCWSPDFNIDTQISTVMISNRKPTRVEKNTQEREKKKPE